MDVEKKRADKRRLQELEKFAQECCESQEKREKHDFVSPEQDRTPSSDDMKIEHYVVASDYNAFDDLSESEEEVVPDQPGMEEIKAIKAWVINNNIPYQSVDKLLFILKKRLLPQIPENTQMLLKWDCDNFDNVDNAEVSDRPMGIRKALNNPNNDVSNIDTIKMETIDCKTDFEFFVTKSLTAIARDVADIKAKQDAINASMGFIKLRQDETVSFLLDKKATKLTNAVVDFAMKYQYSFPITSLERFLEFDKELENNKFLRFDVSIQLCDLLDPDLVITKSMLRMVRYFISKEVAEKFTAVRSARNQSDERTHRFISTTLYGIMCGVVKFKRSKKALEVNDKLFLKGISDVFCNVKSWT
ncbi:uncharacterized protein LOC100679382 [Nasonia vitripennis]|uniref:Uncharacterized protein n=1 Tax=Nasonia vitripennis TaxID=7425 RepID=A0A7M7HDZ8_NASVI|nr:uncharacterized protein LOC100679382 [Nasonia vitripennis]XP_032456624.1 uncharacterized protein LOC100679382 [Nasonia vitripennis]